MTGISRRRLIGLLASSGLAMSAGAARVLALGQAVSAATPHRIDIHHHFAPPAWVTEVKGRPLLQPANTTWTPAKSIEDMDRGGVTTSMVSITNPGLWFYVKALNEIKLFSPADLQAIDRDNALRLLPRLRT